MCIRDRLNGVESVGEQIAYNDSTYELVSKVAYLIGVPLLSLIHIFKIQNMTGM